LSIALSGGKDLVLFANVCKTIVKEGEDIRGNFLAQSVSGAKILIDPNFHVGWLLLFVDLVFDSSQVPTQEYTPLAKKLCSE